MTTELTIWLFGMKTRRSSSLTSTVWMSVICSAVPVTSPTVTRSPIRTGCVNASMMPAPMLLSGVEKASPTNSADHRAGGQHGVGESVGLPVDGQHLPGEDQAEEHHPHPKQHAESSTEARDFVRGTARLYTSEVALEGVLDEPANDDEDRDPHACRDDRSDGPVGHDHPAFGAERREPSAATSGSPAEQYVLVTKYPGRNRYVLLAAGGRGRSRGREPAHGVPRRAGHSLIDNITSRRGMAVVAVVGDGMAGAPGIAARVFSALAAGGINVDRDRAGIVGAQHLVRGHVRAGDRGGAPRARRVSTLEDRRRPGARRAAHRRRPARVRPRRPRAGGSDWRRRTASRACASSACSIDPATSSSRAACRGGG